MTDRFSTGRVDKVNEIRYVTTYVLSHTVYDDYSVSLLQRATDYSLTVIAGILYVNHSLFIEDQKYTDVSLLLCVM